MNVQTKEEIKEGKENGDYYHEGDFTNCKIDIGGSFYCNGNVTNATVICTGIFECTGEPSGTTIRGNGELVIMGKLTLPNDECVPFLAS